MEDNIIKQIVKILSKEEIDTEKLRELLNIYFSSSSEKESIVSASHGLMIELGKSVKFDKLDIVRIEIEKIIDKKAMQESDSIEKER